MLAISIIIHSGGDIIILIPMPIGSSYEFNQWPLTQLALIGRLASQSQRSVLCQSVDTYHHAHIWCS